MEPKSFLKKLVIGLWIIVGIAIIFNTIGWFIDYPKWLKDLLGNFFMIVAGLAFIASAIQIGKKDRKFAMIYAIIGVALVIMAFINFLVIKIIAVVVVVLYLLNLSRVRKAINKDEEITNP
jgi:hypothetical protein